MHRARPRFCPRILPEDVYKRQGRATYSVYQSFKTDKDEGLYGLGQLQNGQMMQRGIEKYLVQGNTAVSYTHLGE